MAVKGINRRQFLAAAAITAAGGGLAGCGNASRATPATDQEKGEATPDMINGSRDRVDTASDSPASFVWRPVAEGGEGPGPRSRHGLAHDHAANATILFGGVVYEMNRPKSVVWRLQSDTWALKGGKWHRCEPAGTIPPARHRGGMVFDEQRGFTVMFGGQAGAEDKWRILNDTWLYEDGRWRQVKPGLFGRHPSPRCGLCLAFDEEAGLTVLFGGNNGNSPSLGDTWLFDGSAWRGISGLAPPVRRYAAFAYDPDLQGCVLHGGSDDESGERGYGDTWLFRDRKWTRLPRGFDTDQRDDHGLAYHRAAKRLVMLEGVGGTRGLLIRGTSGWRRSDVNPLHPRHQCSPMVWDGALGGLVLHGGELHHQGPQLDKTLALQTA